MKITFDEKLPDASNEDYSACLVAYLDDGTVLRRDLKLTGQINTPLHKTANLGETITMLFNSILDYQKSIK